MNKIIFVSICFTIIGVLSVLGAAIYQAILEEKEECEKEYYEKHGKLPN